MKNVIGPGGVRYPVTHDVERLLRSMDRGALQSLVLEFAAYSPEAMRSLQLRATPEDEPTASELLAAVDAALAGVDLDYHDPFYEDIDDGVQEVDEAVDELERHLDEGAHPVVRRVLHTCSPAGRPGTGSRRRRALFRVAERSGCPSRTAGIASGREGAPSVISPTPLCPPPLPKHRYLRMTVGG